MDEPISTEPISDESPTDPRAQRGLALAQAKKDSIKLLIGAKYLVPSATGNGSGYVVDVKAESCSCLDWAQRGGHDRPHRCKHLFAAFYVLKLADGSELLVEKSPRKKKDPRNWKKRSWPATNACRTLTARLGPKLLGELFDGAPLPELEPGKRGRPPVSVRDILKTAALREWEGSTAGQAVVDVDDARKLGLMSVTRVPSYNTLLERFAKPELMPYLHQVLAGSAYVLFPFTNRWTIDGTGFGSSVYDHYFVEKHGKQEQKRRPTKRSRWVEAKIVWSVDLHVIAAVQITEKNAAGGEAGIMPELLRRSVGSGAQVSKWYGDGAYCGEDCAAAVEKAGAEFFVKWKEGVTGKTKKGALWRLHKIVEANPEAYELEYEKGHPLCETGNHMLKQCFGHSLRSRTPNAMYAECMLRCICHNVRCLVMAVEELGIDPKYWAMDLAELPDFGTTQPAMLDAGPTIEVE